LFPDVFSATFDGGKGVETKQPRGVWIHFKTDNAVVKFQCYVITGSKITPATADLSVTQPVQRRMLQYCGYNKDARP
jgi:hypothetical protein